MIFTFQKRISIIINIAETVKGIANTQVNQLNCTAHTILTWTDFVILEL